VAAAIIFIAIALVWIVFASESRGGAPNEDIRGWAFFSTVFGPATLAVLLWVGLSKHVELTRAAGGKETSEFLAAKEQEKEVPGLFLQTQAGPASNGWYINNQGPFATREGALAVLRSGSQPSLTSAPPPLQQTPAASAPKGDEVSGQEVEVIDLTDKIVALCEGHNEHVVMRALINAITTARSAG
jgi:hypothetical protein